MNAKSNNFSSVLEIEKEIFLSTLKKFPLDFERFSEIKDKMNLY